MLGKDFIPKEEFKTINKINRSTYRITGACVALVLFCVVLSIPEVAARRRGKWKTDCKVRASPWSNCSKSCGMGSSVRVRTRGRCKLRRESRLCQVRPCDPDHFGTRIRGKRQCINQVSSRSRLHLEYIGSKSVKTYKMKYCGICKDSSKCCTPFKTRTKKVWFRRKNGSRFAKKMAFVRKCRCHTNCLESPGVFKINLHNDTYPVTL
nr:connective tissue growth factor [Ciona intestinalis]|eukprot:XP_002130917.1 connective tissue growth factor [Ciona intestinalis]